MHPVVDVALPGLFWLLCCLVGYGTALLVLPPHLRRDRLVMMPVVGAGALLWLSAGASYVGLPMQRAAPLIVLAGLSLSAAGVWSARGRPMPAASWRNALFVHGLSAAAAASVLASVVLYRAWDPYNDAFTYVAIGDYLLGHGYFTPADPGAHHPVLTQIALYQRAGYRMGSNFLLAFFAGLVRATYTLDVFPSVQALALALGVPGFWLLCRRALQLRPLATGLACVIYALHVGVPIPNALQGFMPQTLGMAFVFPLIAWQVQATGRRHRVRRVLAAGLMCALGLLTYPEILPFIVAAVGCWFLWRLVTGRLRFADALVGAVGPWVVGSLLAPVAAVSFLSVIVRQAGSLVGADVHLSLFDYLSMLTGFRSVMMPATQPPGLRYGLLRVAVVAATAIALYGAFTMRPGPRRRLVCLSLPFALGLVAFGLFGVNPWNPAEYGQPWNTYKLVTYAFFLFAAVWGLGLAELWSRGGPFRLSAFAMLGAFVLFFPVATHYLAGRAAASMRRFTGVEDDPIAEYKRLPALLAQLPPDSPVNLLVPGEANRHRQLVAYFLRRPVIADWSDDVYIWPHLAPANRALSIDPAYPTLAYLPAAGRPLAARLVYQPPGSSLLTVFGEGWHALETDGESSWRWLERDGELVLTAPRAGGLVLQADVAVVGAPQRVLTLSIVGRPDLDGRYPLPQQWFTPFTSRRIDLPAGRYIVRIAADGPAQPMSATDTRVARVGLRNTRWSLLQE
jgi:hypothetical protein